MNLKLEFGDRIAIIGASKDKSKFSNKAVRAFKESKFKVFPVNINEKEIEGIKCYKKLGDIDDKIDIVSLYLPPNISVAHNIPYQIREKRVRHVILNPGSESDELLEKFKEAKIKPILACSIRSIGKDPDKL